MYFQYLLTYLSLKKTFSRKKSKMYGSSTQFQSWTFRDEHELTKLRIQANSDFIEKFGKDMMVSKE